MTAPDPDRACPHEEFVAEVDVARLTETDDGPVTAFVPEIKISCEACGERFRWVGVPAGYSPRQPMVDVSEITLYAPMRPASSDPDFGMGVPGFAIQQVVDPS